MATERRRVYIRPTPAEFASHEAIEDFAARLWQAFTQAEGIHMATQLTERYADAVAYAAAAHAAQRRKGADIPYIAHLLAVSGSVLEAGGDEDQAIAGLLHDVVEDQGGLARAEDVRTRFGDRVADIVLGCSDSTAEDRKDKLPYAERKADHIAHLREASDDVLLVTAADKLHNARAIQTDLMIDGPDMLTRFNGEPDQILANYRLILDVLESREIAPVLVVPLRHVVEKIATLMPTPGEGAGRPSPWSITTTRPTGSSTPITPRRGSGSPRAASSCSSWPTRPAST